jgi:hypothetical protein
MHYLTIKPSAQPLIQHPRRPQLRKSTLQRRGLDNNLIHSPLQERLLRLARRKLKVVVPDRVGERQAQDVEGKGFADAVISTEAEWMERALVED